MYICCATLSNKYGDIGDIVICSANPSGGTTFLTLRV